MSELVQYREQRQPDPIMLIRQSGKAQSTITQYIRALEPYLAHGGNLGDPVALSEYARTLSKSRRAHLRSAVALWTKSASALLKATATPENLEKTQAALMRLEALPQAIQVEPVKGQKAHIWLSPKQVKELMNTCGSDVVGLRDRTVLGLLAGAGLRRAELADLTWESVVQQPAGDKMRTVLEVRGKGTKDRVVPISAKLAALLDEWAAVTGRQGHIVRSLGMAQDLGENLSTVAIFKIVRKHGAMIGLPELAAHDLRRTYAQLGFGAGVPITQVSKLLGHSSVETTQRYLNLDLGLEVMASDFVPV